jgi:hypothetical protein
MSYTNNDYDIKNIKWQAWIVLWEFRHAAFIFSYAKNGKLFYKNKQI